MRVWALHEHVMSSLVGPNGALWRVHCAFALTVASTCPSGDLVIVQLHDDLRHAAFHVHHGEPFPFAPARLFHQGFGFGGASLSHAYVGIGTIDCQGRPSLGAGPFFFMDPLACDLIVRYDEYMDYRARSVSMLAPLAGKVLICDSDLGRSCHARSLLRRVNYTFPCKLDPEST